MHPQPVLLHADDRLTIDAFVSQANKCVPVMLDKTHVCSMCGQNDGHAVMWNVTVGAQGRIGCVLCVECLGNLRIPGVGA